MTAKTITLKSTLSVLTLLILWGVSVSSFGQGNKGGNSGGGKDSDEIEALQEQVEALSSALLLLQEQVDSLGPQTLNVDCDADPGALQAAVLAASPWGAVITVSGVCGPIVIDGKKNIVIDGQGLASINGDTTAEEGTAIEIIDSQAIQIGGLTIEGSHHRGVWARGSSVELSEVAINAVTENGVEIFQASNSTMDGLSITSCANGLVVGKSSRGQINGGSITCSGLAIWAHSSSWIGVEAYLGSVVNLVGDLYVDLASNAYIDGTVSWQPLSEHRIRRSSFVRINGAGIDENLHLFLIESDSHAQLPDLSSYVTLRTGGSVKMSTEVMEYSVSCEGPVSWAWNYDSLDGSGDFWVCGLEQ